MTVKDMTNEIIDLLCDFEDDYGMSLAFRTTSHAKVVAKHLNAGEKPLAAFCGQKNDDVWDIFSSCVVVITNKRIIIGQKRVLFGYYLSSITSDLFNDLKVEGGIIFGKVIINMIREKIIISNLSKKALPYVETIISETMMEHKKRK